LEEEEEEEDEDEDEEDEVLSLEHVSWVTPLARVGVVRRTP
jgi:hypothetical protein